MQRNTLYFTIIAATHMFFNCVFSERTCVLISVGQSWQYRLRSKTVANAKKYLVFYNYHCYLLTFQLCIFRAYLHAHLCWILLTNRSIQKERFLTNAKINLVFYCYYCYLHVFQLCIFRVYLCAHLCWTLLTKISIQK